MYDSSCAVEGVDRLEHERQFFRSLAASKVDGIIFCSEVPKEVEQKYIKNIHKLVKGYLQVLKDSKVEIKKEPIIARGDFSHQSGYNCMKKLLKEHSDIDGVYIVNDQMAVGACMYLKETNVKIPEEIKVIGYDNAFVSNIVDPAITTIHVSKKKMGLEAARALFRKIEAAEEVETIRIQLPTRLIERQTTIKNIKNDWILLDW